jgi:4-hydroxy-3-polyprenylbenzoate decarboxylase
MGLMALAKGIIVVDHNVNVHNLSEVAWRVSGNIDPAQDIVLASGPLDDLDFASPTPRFGSKVGIDATAKGPMDGREREWPEEIAMDADIKALVDKRWQEYGL